jgi:hypothetical protein
MNLNDGAGNSVTMSVICLKTLAHWPIGPLEVDAAGHQVLIRSTPPDERPAGVKFYEIILTSHSSGNCTLRRYESEQGTIGRVPVDIQLTHEVLLKLVGDLLDTAQAAT